MSGNKVVWLRHRNVDTSNELRYFESPYDICGADVTDRDNPVYFTIAEEVGHGAPYPADDYTEAHEGYLDISGNIVVWEGDGDIYGADITDDGERLLAEVRMSRSVGGWQQEKLAETRQVQVLDEKQNEQEESSGGFLGGIFS